MIGDYIKLLHLKSAEIISNQYFQIEKNKEQKMQAILSFLKVYVSKYN